ncbi:MAG TPA: peptidylprolyl isomerase [Myxococcales bacterium]|nr:peptidylprolyl isomerase [Myxococcales bacterium]
MLTLLACLALLIPGCKKENSTAKSAAQGAAKHTPVPNKIGSATTDKDTPKSTKKAAAAPPIPPLKKSAGRGPLVSYSPGHLAEFTKDLGTGTLGAIIETNHGTLNCELFEKQAPRTVANFVGLARGKREYIDAKTGQPTRGAYFDGTRCHRVIPNFMMQCGDPTGTGRGGPGFRFADEFSPELSHSTGGMLSMANAGPSTNGSQFFITERPTPHLNNRHAVFGRCKEVDLIKKITRVEKDPNDRSRSRPKDPVILKKVTIVRI